MKRLIALITALVLLMTAVPVLSLAADDAGKASLRQELETHGTIDMAMNVYASKIARYYQGDFVDLLRPDAHAFQAAVNHIYGYATNRSESIMQALLNLGYAYAEGDGSWDLTEEQVALYIKYLLYLADLEDVPFGEALAYVQQAMPRRNKQLDGLNFLADLLTVGFDVLGKGFLRLGDGILKGANAIPEGKVFYQVLEGAFKTMGTFNNTSDVLLGVSALLDNSAQMKGLLNSYQRTSSGLAVLEPLTDAAINDPLLLTARNALYETYTDFEKEVAKLSGDDAGRKKLQDGAALNNMFNNILAGKLQPYYPKDKLLDALETTRNLADVFLTGGLSTTILNGGLYVAEQLIGTKSAYAHMHAMTTIDEIYAAVADGMHNGDKWQSRILHAEEVQRLCLLAALGETHMYNLVNTDAGAGRKLWNSIGKAISGKDQMQANQLWYDLTIDRLSSTYAAAQEFIDALMNHYADLCSVAADIEPLLGHENESMGTVSGYLIKDKWFALPDGSGKPDYDNPNPEAGEPVKDTQVQLLQGETVIASATTDGEGRYVITYPRHAASGQLTIRVSPENVDFAKRDMAGPVYAANALPSYFRFDADLESPAAADGAETIAPALPYADDYFLDGNEYSHDLALASLGLSAAAVREDLIRAAWGSLGYSLYASGRYDLPADTVTNAAPYTIAVKTFADPDARDEEPKERTVVALCVGSPLDAAGMANAVASTASREAAQQIADDLERCILASHREGVPMTVWVMGFSWGGKVADSALSALVGRPGLTGKYTSSTYTFAAPGHQVVQGYNFVYAEDPIGMGLTNPDEKRFTIYGTEAGAEQKRVASIFHQLTQGNTAYDPASYKNPSGLSERLQQLPAGDQRTGLITGLTQWRMLAGGGGDFRLLTGDARHVAVLGQTGRASASAAKTAEIAMAAAPIPVMKVLPEDAEEEMTAVLTDAAALCEQYAGPMDSEMAVQLTELLFALGDDLGNPTSAQSSAFAHHPEMYLAWLLGVNGKALTGMDEPDAFGGRVLEQPVNLKGTVYNEESGQPLANVTVTVKGSSFSRQVITDENGEWKMLVPVEDLSILFRQEGFEDATETVAAACFSEGVVELTTYMKRIPMPILVITTENHMEKGNDYRSDYGIPKAWSSINKKFGRQFEKAISSLYEDMEEDIRKNRRYSCTHHNETHTSFTHPVTVYSTGYLLSISIANGYYHCDIGHNVYIGHSFTFDVATGKQLSLLDLLDPENGSAGEDFIAAIRSSAKKEGTTLSRKEAERIYAHLLLKEGNRNKYARWNLAADGIDLLVDNLNIGIFQCNSVHIPYKKLEGIIAKEYLPAAPVGKGVCELIPVGDLAPDYDNTPSGNTMLKVNGLVNQIWVNDNVGDNRETVWDRFRFFYAYGLADALIRLPQPLDRTFTVQWEDSTGVHFVHGGK